MKYIALYALVFSSIIACSSGDRPLINRKQIREDGLKNLMEIVCIDGVQYITFSDINKYGITVKFNSDGTVSTCDK